MDSGKNKRKLKNFWINTEIQHRIIVVNLLFMMLVLILTMAIIYTHLYEREAGLTGMWNFAFGEVNMSISYKLILLYALLIITFLLSIISQLWITHRICGPMVNFCNAFREISRGDFLKRINIRKDDLLKKEADQFNEMVVKISELVGELKDENARLNAAVAGAIEKNSVPGD